jgi:hypothetical protein
VVVPSVSWSDPPPESSARRGLTLQDYFALLLALPLTCTCSRVLVFLLNTVCTPSALQELCGSGSIGGPGAPAV